MSTKPGITQRPCAAAVRVDDLARLRGGERGVAQRDHGAVADADVADAAGRAGAVEDQAVVDREVDHGT
jgi:hypothetical protein